jgi:hypothetical protein
MAVRRVYEGCAMVGSLYPTPARNRKTPSNPNISTDQKQHLLATLAASENIDSTRIFSTTKKKKKKKKKIRARTNLRHFEGHGRQTAGSPSFPEPKKRRNCSSRDLNSRSSHYKCDALPLGHKSGDNRIVGGCNEQHAAEARINPRTE